MSEQVRVNVVTQTIHRIHSFVKSLMKSSEAVTHNIYEDIDEDSCDIKEILTFNQP